LDYDSLYWNNVSAETPLGQDYDILLAEHYRDSHLELIERWLDLSSGKTVLKTDLFAEAKCPARSFFRELVKRDCFFTASDISDQICMEAKNLTGYSANPVSYVATNICSTPFSDGYFDIIISDSTLDHYQEKDQIKVALREIARILKPGGTLLITLDNKSNITEPLFRLYIALGLSPFYIGKTYNMKELKQALRETGFKIIDDDYLIHNPRFFAKLFIRILRKLDGRKSSSRISRMLAYFDSFKNKKSRFLTSQFIAVKAEKLL